MSVAGNWIVTIPFIGTKSEVTMLKIISLVLLTIPPWKEIVRPEREFGVKVTCAEAELLEVSEPTVPMKGFVVRAEKGLIMLLKVIST